MIDLTGKQFGPYKIVRQLGMGGMADVYIAYQPSVEREVVLKILPRHLSQDPTFFARFKHEAKLLAKLQHPHILHIHDYGEEDGYAYIVMPYIKSGDLGELLEEKRLSSDEIVGMMTQVGDALDYAHAQGIVHRDIKPSNILLDERGNCFLTDFGIAKLVQGTSAKLTATHQVVGTPAYMSPEQGLGEKLDGRSDIYGLGIVLYEMLTGAMPFEAETPIGLIHKHISTPPTPPREMNANLPPAIEQVILKSLAKQPEDRYATAADLVDALQTAFASPLPVEPEAPVKPALIDAEPARTRVLPSPPNDAPRDNKPPAVNREPAAQPGLSNTMFWAIIGIGVILSLTVIISVWLMTRPSPLSPLPAAAPAQEQVPAAAPPGEESETPVLTLPPPSPTTAPQAPTATATAVSLPTSTPLPPTPTLASEGPPPPPPTLDSTNRPPPPPFAFEACTGLEQNAACTIQPPGGATINGTCQLFTDGLACAPAGQPLPPGTQ